MIALHVRWMIRRDLPEVLDIESLCFPNPWSQDDFIDWLRRRDVIGKVAEYEDRVLGFLIYELLEKRLAIVNLAVLPSMQRSGIGRAMFDELRGKLSVERRSRLVMNIRESNLDAHLWARAMGMQCVGVKQGYYDDSDDDAYQFEYVLRKVQSEGLSVIKDGGVRDGSSASA